MEKKEKDGKSFRFLTAGIICLFTAAYEAVVGNDRTLSHYGSSFYTYAFLFFMLLSCGFIVAAIWRNDWKEKSE